MYYQCNIKGTFAKPLLLGKAIGITHSECVSMALFIQHAKGLLVLYCHLWSAWLYHIFFTLPHTWHDFRKEVIEHKMGFEFFCNFVRNISHSKKN
jgi:hypothetical protein